MDDFIWKRKIYQQGDLDDANRVKNQPILTYLGENHVDQLFGFTDIFTHQGKFKHKNLQ